jgi:putative inorganic carbon (HCO3(-)) transporter
LNMVAERPLTGVGFGNFTDVSDSFNPELAHQYTAHSIWFLVLGETGLPGFAAFTALIISGLLSAGRTLRRLEDASAAPILRAVALGLTGGLAGFCVSGSFVSYSYQWPLYTILAMIVALSRCTPATGEG